MNCLVGQSGGPTSVINSSLAGVIKASFDNNFKKVYALLHGIEGLLTNNFVEIDKEKYLKTNSNKKLQKKPSSILGSCRYKLPEDLNAEIYVKIFDKLKELKITNFVYIGGNDSMDTVDKLNKYMSINEIYWIKIVGCPKTIDNDLFGMDHSPGFASAAKFIMNTVKDIRTDVDIYSLKTVTFVEVMGRNTGWLAAASYLLNESSKKDIVNLVYISEKSVSKDQILEDIKEAHKKEPNLIIVISEGFMDEEKFFEHVEYRSYDEGFNHPIISGISRQLSEYVYNKMGLKTKAIELNITQRTNHMISKTDADEAYLLGYKAILGSLTGTNIVPVINRVSDEPYEIVYSYVESDTISNKEKFLPKDWVKTNDILREKICKYVKPLVCGEVIQESENGIHKYIELEDFIK